MDTIRVCLSFAAFTVWLYAFTFACTYAVRLLPDPLPTAAFVCTRVAISCGTYAYRTLLFGVRLNIVRLPPRSRVARGFAHLLRTLQHMRLSASFGCTLLTFAAHVPSRSRLHCPLTRATARAFATRLPYTAPRFLRALIHAFRRYVRVLDLALLNYRMAFGLRHTRSFGVVARLNIAVCWTITRTYTPYSQFWLYTTPHLRSSHLPAVTACVATHV